MFQYLGSSLRVCPQQRRGGYTRALAPSRAPLPRPSKPPLYPSLRTRAHTHTLSRRLAHAYPTYTRRAHTHKRGIIPKTKRVSFPHGGGGSKVEELSLSRWVGRGCGGAAATERRSAVGTLDRMIRPSQRGYFSPAAISRSAIHSTEKTARSQSGIRRGRKNKRKRRGVVTFFSRRERKRTPASQRSSIGRGYCPVTAVRLLRVTGVMGHCPRPGGPLRIVVLSSSCSRLTKRGTGCVECVSRGLSQIGVARAPLDVSRAREEKDREKR